MIIRVFHPLKSRELLIDRQVNLLDNVLHIARNATEFDSDYKELLTQGKDGRRE